MKILLSIPHKSLFGPQGHEHRLAGVLSLIPDAEIDLLVPEGSDLSQSRALDGRQVHFFKEISFFGRAIPYFTDYSRHFLATIQRLVEEKQYDFVIFDFPWGLFRFALLSELPAVYLSQGVETQFIEVTLEHLGVNIAPVRMVLQAYVRFVERNACRAASLIITMSEHDAKWYHENFGIEENKLLSLAQPVEKPQPCLHREQLREDLGFKPNQLVIIFHGSWNHLPNREAIESIKNEIAPSVSNQTPEVLFVVAGPDVPIEKSQHYCSLGFVENLKELLFAADIAVVPIYRGAGVRMKIFDMLLAGLPIVSTRKGFEGLELEQANAVQAVVDEPNAVSRALVSLLRSESRRGELAENGAKFLEVHHDAAKLSQLLKSKLRPLLKTDPTDPMRAVG